MSTVTCREDEAVVIAVADEGPGTRRRPGASGSSGSSASNRWA